MVTVGDRSVLVQSPGGPCSEQVFSCLPEVVPMDPRTAVLTGRQCGLLFVPHYVVCSWSVPGMVLGYKIVEGPKILEACNLGPP